MAQGWERKLRQVQSSSFSKIRDRIFDRFPLSGRTRLRIQRDVAAFFRRGKHSSEFHQKFFPVGLIMNRAQPVRSRQDGLIS